MAFEKTAMDQVKYDVAVEHQEKINPWFEKGTMWCDYINEDVGVFRVDKMLGMGTPEELRVSKIFEKREIETPLTIGPKIGTLRINLSQRYLPFLVFNI